MADDLGTFYDLVRRTRAGVLDWLDTLPEDVLNAERDDFAFGSLSRIFSHVAECYLLWLSRGGVGRPERGLHATDADGLRQAFGRVDAVVAEAHHTGQALALACVIGPPHPGTPDTDLVPPGWL